ncbi:MAG: hypothetical protein IPK75_12705 [Acidobacteria bacterium]|nr:hypothetical protein [Acidobacteriota bacterium]
MTGSHKALREQIKALDADGVHGAEISRRLNCSRSYVSQVLSFTNVLLPTQAAKPAPHRRAPAPTTCQRPDRRKGFAVCGEPKMKTACGETLGVCAYHFETTKPHGGMKL